MRPLGWALRMPKTGSSRWSCSGAMGPAVPPRSSDRRRWRQTARCGCSASNNWVVDGAHAESGKPVLANDPHLGFAAPGFWYLARLKTPQGEIAGGTVAGVPLVVVGHNERVAWGFTTTGGDVEDLFIERLDPADPNRYLTPEGSAAFSTREELINVRGAAPVAVTARSTRHGPVLSDVLPEGSAENGYVLALQP